MTTRDEVVAAARDWIGVRFQHQGRSRLGVDCVGLVVGVTNDLQLTAYDYSGYPRLPEGNTFLSHFARGGWQRIEIKDARPGDLMAFRASMFACHVAMLTQAAPQPRIIHSHAMRRKVVEEPMMHEWLSQLVAAFATPGLL